MGLTGGGFIGGFVSVVRFISVVKSVFGADVYVGVGVGVEYPLSVQWCCLPSRRRLSLPVRPRGPFSCANCTRYCGVFICSITPFSVDFVGRYYPALKFLGRLWLLREWGSCLVLFGSTFRTAHP